MRQNGEFSVVALARQAVKKAQQSRVNGITIDLSDRGIERLSDEAIDVIQPELERLALSRNRLTSLPMRLARCTSLRYLNVRNNAFEALPLAICSLPALEFLDLGRNQLRVLPADIARLKTLRVLAIQDNRIPILPDCLADMTELQVIKCAGNPLRVPPAAVLEARRDGGEAAVTIEIKQYLQSRRNQPQPQSQPQPQPQQPEQLQPQPQSQSQLQLQPQPQQLHGHLAVLPIRRTADPDATPLRDAARCILFAIVQAQYLVRALSQLVGLEAVAENAVACSDHLGWALQTREDDQHLQHACLRLLGAYAQVCNGLAARLDGLLDTTDPRYLRALQVHIYSSSMELRQVTQRPKQPPQLKPPPQSKPSQSKPPQSKPTPQSMVPPPQQQQQQQQKPPPPQPLPQPRQRSRSRSRTRQTDRRAMLLPRRQDSLADGLVLSLQRSGRLVSRTLPGLRRQFARTPALVAECTAVLQQADELALALAARPSTVPSSLSLATPGHAFVESWVRLGMQIKAAPDVLQQLPPNGRQALRAIQESMKESTSLLMASNDKPPPPPPDLTRPITPLTAQPILTRSP